MKRNLFTLVFLFCCCLFMQGQEIKVEAFSKLERDLTPRTEERLDLNDEPCSILKIVVAHVKDFRFEGNIVGDVIYKEGEIWVYMPTGSRNITIQNDKYGVLRYTFPERLKKQTAYEVQIKLVENLEKKVRTLVMPVIGIGKGHPSYGFMLGFVRNTGPYVKVKYDFSNFSSNLECGDDGIIKGTSDTPWYTGEKRQSRMSVTAGVIQRLGKLSPFYAYAGLGYGYNKLGWETVNGDWVKNTDQSCDGIEVEIGGIYRLKNISFMAGIQTNSFSYIEATLGVGFMF